MSNKVFKVVLLQALPASGKSEVRNFMAHVEPERLRDEFHIGVAADRLLNASAKVSVTENSYSDCHVIVLHIFCIQ